MRARLFLTAATLVIAGFPRAADAAPDPRIASALTITKSSNKNQVRYAVDVNDQCAPTGAAPVHPYWRMLERGPEATEPLTASEQRGFGIDSQTVDGDSVRIVVRGLRTRPITIRTWRAPDGSCSADASITIEGVWARIANVFVKLGFFGISYIQLSGVGPSGAVVTERISAR